MLLQISVEDTGIGIRPEVRELLFKPFSQADGSTTRKYGGTGLGLAISHEIVSHMGGVLDCESEPGKGSKFFFDMQIEAVQKNGRRTSQPDINKLIGARVLIIDDNATNREILERQTAAWKMYNESASSGLEGLERLRSAQQSGKPFDLAILDMQMPEMDGLEVAQRINGDPEIADVKMIMLTSIGLRGDAQLVKQSGASAYLTKPTRQSDLYTCLFTVIDEDIQYEEPPQLVTRHSIAENRRNQLDIHILVVEDNETNQEVVKSMLKKLGCRVSIASNGREAVDAVSENSYNLIFMDCQMPVMDGYQATADIRRLEDKKEGENYTPIIALTANALEGDREKCLTAGMDDYLSKPFKQDEIRKKIEKWSTAASNLFPEDEAVPSVQRSEKKEASSPIDRTVLDTLRELQIDGEPDIIKEITDRYLRSSEPLVTNLRQAVIDKNFEVAHNSAHSLKSSSANVGALKLSEVCKELEINCKETKYDNAEDLASVIEAEFVRVKNTLNMEEQ